MSGVEQYDRDDERKFARVSGALTLQKGLTESVQKAKKRRRVETTPAKREPEGWLAPDPPAAAVVVRQAGCLECEP